MATVLNKENFAGKVADLFRYPYEWIFKGSKLCLIDFYKVNVKEEPDLEEAFNICDIPELLFYTVEKLPIKNGYFNQSLNKSID